jgi:hypothetical protein
MSTNNWFSLIGCTFVVIIADLGKLFEATVLHTYIFFAFLAKLSDKLSTLFFQLNRVLKLCTYCRELLLKFLDSLIGNLILDT